MHLDQFDDDLICHMCNPVVICVSVRSALCNNFLCECNVTCYVVQCIRSCVWHLCDPFGICVNVTLCVIACVSAMAISNVMQYLPVMCVMINDMCYVHTMDLASTGVSLAPCVVSCVSAMLRAT